MQSPDSLSVEPIYLAGGCFWCMEAVFQQVRGVLSVENGYANGDGRSASYEAVCTGTTGYAEVVRLQYDPREIALEHLLAIFFTVHDPTSLNRQGADIGTQYRSGIYCESEAQLSAVQAWVDQARTHYDRPVVTEIALVQHYQPAEDYHQDYFNQHPNQGYCARVVAPKVEKFRQVFANWQR